MTTERIMMFIERRLAKSGHVRSIAIIASIFLVALINGNALATSKASDEVSIERGRYLTKITGCNDCHTQGYPESGGKIPEKDWLAGSPVGWLGPWGTTYSSNIRSYFQNISEDTWVINARSMRSRPPMPSFTLNIMKDEDLRSIYRFIRSLGPSDKTLVPNYLPPGKMPQPPYNELVLPPQSK